MNKRQIAVKVGLNKAETLNKLPLTQGDRNSHSFYISFEDEVTLTDYQLLVFYQFPGADPIRPVVDKFDLSEENRKLDIVISEKALKRTGELVVEFGLKHKTTNSYLTVNERLRLEVTGTINGAILEALPGENLQLSIDQQIEKIEYLLKVTDGITNDFNDNATDRTNLFNNNYNEKIQAFDKNASDSATAFNEFVSKTVEGAYKNLDKVASQSAEKAATAANEKVKTQETTSIANIQGTTKTEIQKAIQDVESAKTEAIVTAQFEINNYVETTSKNDISNYVETTSKSEIENYVNNISKSALDSHVETVSKKEIDNYVSQKENQIKGATFTPTLRENGELSFTNDKGLENPPVVNIKGPKGDKPVKGTDYYTEEEKQQFVTETNTFVTAEGKKQVGLIEKKGIEEINKVIKECSKQVGLVNTEGVKVIGQVKEIVGVNPPEGNALSLGGKTRPEFDKEIQGIAGGYQGNFPLTSAVVNGVYLVPATGKFYVCTKAYSGGNLTAPNANFEELSVWKNRDKLENLSKIENAKISLIDEQGGTIKLNLYKLGKIVFCSLSGSNFKCSVINFSNKIPSEYLPIDSVALTLGNSHLAEYFVQFKINGDIYVNGTNSKLVNIPFRSFCYFVKK